MEYEAFLLLLEIFEFLNRKFGGKIIRENSIQIVIVICKCRISFEKGLSATCDDTVNN